MLKHWEPHVDFEDEETSLMELILWRSALIFVLPPVGVPTELSCAPEFRFKSARLP